MFWLGQGRVSTEVMIRNVSVPAQNSSNYLAVNCSSSPCLLDDPYEGEMYAVMMYLFSPNLTAQEREDIWKVKRNKLQAVQWQHLQVQRGWWYSAHEMWKYLELPYYRCTTNWQVFCQGEQARVLFSSLQNYPGLFASCNVPFTYLSASGIQPLAFEQIQSNAWVTPYATFPVLLANQTIGLVWLAHMLNGSRCQGPLGTTESIAWSNGTITPVVTWDAKAVTVLGLLGGIGPLVESGLEEEGKLSKFVEVVNKEWGRVFNSSLSIGFSLPTKPMNRTVHTEFTGC